MAVSRLPDPAKLRLERDVQRADDLADALMGQQVDGERLGDLVDGGRPRARPRPARAAADGCAAAQPRRDLTTIPSRKVSIAKRKRVSPSPVTSSVAWATIRG